MATGKALDGKPYAGNPHVRFDEGEVAPATTPRRGSLLYKTFFVLAACAAGLCGADIVVDDGETVDRAVAGDGKTPDTAPIHTFVPSGTMLPNLPEASAVPAANATPRSQHPARTALIPL